MDRPLYQRVRSWVYSHYLRYTNEPNWARILRSMYLGEMTVSEDSLHGINRYTNPETADKLKKVNQISSDTGINPTEVSRTIEFMRDIKLVEDLEPSEKEKPAFGLSRKGFDVAHERELTKRQDRTNQILAILTAGLLATATAQASAAIFSLNGVERTITFAAMIFIGAVVVLLFSFRQHG